MTAPHVPPEFSPRDDTGIGSPAPDLEYDLAHEWIASGGVLGDAGDRAPSHSPPKPAQCGDYDGGDYGYDLAHDIPR